MKTLPTLYSLTATGATQQWTIHIEGNQYWTEAGQVGGTITKHSPVDCFGKNQGKKNQTTNEEQAIAEAQAKWDKKAKTGYHSDITKINQMPYVECMLAKNFNDRKGKVKYPVGVQIKFNGCLEGSSLIKTKEYGYKPISYIVEKKLDCKVQTFNEKTKKKEYNQITNWFTDNEYNGETQWFQIHLSSGEKLTLTGNHKVYLPELECWRRVDELTEEDYLEIF